MRDAKEMNRRKVLILAGGGGHTSISLALAQFLCGKVEISFLAPKDDLLSKKILFDYGKVDYLIKARKPFTPNYVAILRFPIAFIQSLFKVKRDFNLVISSGSNFCIPPALVAWIKGIPIINIESRVAIRRPSKTAKILQHFSHLTVLQWEEQKRNLRGVVTGPIFPKPQYEPWNGGYILVTGGTEGHKTLFDAMDKSNLKNIVLQTGKIDPTVYRERHPQWEVFSLTENFQKIIAGAEIVITHQGGGTIFESITYKKPLIIVFNSQLKRTASKEDIKFLAKKLNLKYIDVANLDTIIEAIKNINKNSYRNYINGREKLEKLILKNLEVY